MATTNGSVPNATSDGAALPDNPNVIDVGNDDFIPASDGDGSADNPRDPALAVKRGRGRPRKDGGTGNSGGTDTGTGRAEKSSAGKSFGQKTTKLDVELFARQIVGAHLMLSKLLKNPFIEISQQEAESLALALKNVMVHHSINIAPATLAYVQLVGVCLALYGPRIAIIMAAKRAEREANMKTFNADGSPVQA